MKTLITDEKLKILKDHPEEATMEDILDMVAEIRVCRPGVEKLSAVLDKVLTNENKTMNENFKLQNDLAKEIMTMNLDEGLIVN